MEALTMGIRLVLVDDHTLVRKGLRAVLRRVKAVRVVGEASDGQMAVELARQHKPDVILMDVVLPALNGIDATRQITEELDHVRVIGLTAFPDEELSAQMRDAGAVGYLRKTCGVAELTRAIRTVVKGGTCFEDPPIDDDNPVIDANAVGLALPLGPELSDREREVLKLLSDGVSTRDTARRLHVSAKTVESHRRNVMRKLRIYSIAGLTKYAIREGLTEPEP